MSKSYPTGDQRVNAAPPPGKRAGAPAPPSPRDRPRDTATFTPYYWEAYNEIVEIKRYNHYFLKRWARDLGPLGCMIVQVLRDRCYHNPSTGVLRNECVVKMQELADQLGVHRATLFREFERNQALSQFIRPEKLLKMVGGRPHQDANAYHVCMDEPIHPADLAHYEDLRAIKEEERARAQAEADARAGGGKKPPRVRNEDGSPYQSHFATHSDFGRSYESQNATPGEQSHFATYESQNDPPIEDHLPSGDLLTKESLTPAAGDPPINSPEGEEEGPDCIAASLALATAWSQVQDAVRPTMNIPAFNTHIRMLKPADQIELPDGSAEIVLTAPSAWAREWLNVRQIDERLAQAFTDALQRPCTVRLTLIKGGS